MGYIREGDRVGHVHGGTGVVRAISGAYAMVLWDGDVTFTKPCSVANLYHLDVVV